MIKNTEKIKEPEQLHKQQVSLLIWLPVIAASVICAIVFILLIVSTSAEPQSTEQWAQISTMFLIIPAAFLGLALMAILVLLGTVFGKWNKKWPAPLQQFRLKIISFENSIQGVVQKLAQPVIGVKSALAGFQAIFKK